MLGDLDVAQIEKRIGFEFPDDIRSFMMGSHQSKASNVKKGKWHCFDIPFTLVCGDMETAQKIYDSVKARAAEVKEPLQISISS